jgi:two-component system, response regulator RegA
VVEDDDALRERLVRALGERGFAAQGAASVAHALELAADAPEYAVVDLRIGNESGLDVVRALLERDPATRVVMLTGYGSIATAVEAMRLGAVHYLTKPAEREQIGARQIDAPGRTLRRARLLNCQARRTRARLRARSARPT